jgi:D-lactate dehydrogenase (cytochrome)
MREKLYCGREIKGKLPKYKMPHVKKNTSGYYNKPGMDMIDLFIGSDGTLGIISEIEIELNKTFDVIWGLTIFMPDEDKALDLVRALRHEIKIADINLNINPSAIEFFSHKVPHLQLHLYADSTFRRLCIRWYTHRHSRNLLRR